jgi:PPE-repeat protein
MVDFAMLPPEINSGLMYSGAGSGPMLAAATAWEGLSAELQTTAASYAALVNNLTDGAWQGPSSAAMVAAALPQISWLSGTAEQAQQAASQATAAATAYEAAFAATVPPSEIAANRALLMSLLATNFLGQNTAAIAATEALYGEMWAQDSATMYGYSGVSAQTTALTPFSAAAETLTPGGIVDQIAATAQSYAASLGVDVEALKAVPASLMQMAGFTNTPPWLTDLDAAMNSLGLTGYTWNAAGDGIVVNGVLGDVVEGLTGSATLDASTAFDSYIRLVSPTRLTTTTFKDVQGLVQPLLPAATKAAEGAAHAAEGVAHAAEGALGGGVRGIAGSVGNALPVGGLRVPASWAGVAAPAPTPAVVSLHGLGAAAAAEPATNAFGGMPMMGTGTGRSAAGHFAAPRYGFKPTVVAHPLAGG